jgi:hypothetical protein
MPTPRSRPGTPGCSPPRYRAASFSSIPATGTSPSSGPPGRCLHRSQHRAARAARQVPAEPGGPLRASPYPARPAVRSRPRRRHPPS